MRFVRLEAENFKSFEAFVINLDGHGFVKIDGVNNTDSFSESVGSGKSTIADALSYALTGETVKGNSSMSDVKNMYTKGKCRVAVEFEHEGKTYIIVRGEDELSITEDGVNISKHLKNETKELIRQMFPMFTPTFIGATVIIGQNMPNAFTNNKPSARKQILEELTNSSFMIEEIKTMLAERKNDWQSEVGQLNTDIVVFETKIDANRNTITRATQKRDALADSVQLESEINEMVYFISTAEGKLSELRHDLTEAEGKKDQAQAETTRLRKMLDEARVKHNTEVSAAVEGLLKEKSGVELELAEVRAEYRAKETEATKLRAEISKLQSAPTHCPTCGQPLPDAHKIDTTAQEEELARLVAELDALKVRGKSLSDSVTALGDKVLAYKAEHRSSEVLDGIQGAIFTAEGLVQQFSSSVSALRDKVSRGEYEISNARTRESRLRTQLGELATIRKTCEEDIARAEGEIAEAEETKKGLAEKLEKKQERLSKLNQVISFATREFRTILLSSIIRRLDAYAKSYCRKMLDTTEIDFRDDGNNISITYRGRDFGVLSGGESQVVRMCITLALKKTLEDLVGFTTNIMFFDEILDNCDKSTAQQLIELVSGLELGSTFFISHHDDVYLPVDQTWTVTKTDCISSLEVLRV